MDIKPKKGKSGVSFVRVFIPQTCMSVFLTADGGDKRGHEGVHHLCEHILCKNDTLNFSKTFCTHYEEAIDSFERGGAHPPSGLSMIKHILSHTVDRFDARYTSNAATCADSMSFYTTSIPRKHINDIVLTYAKQKLLSLLLPHETIPIDHLLDEKQAVLNEATRQRAQRGAVATALQLGINQQQKAVGLRPTASVIGDNMIGVNVHRQVMAFLKSDESLRKTRAHIVKLCGERDLTGTSLFIVGGKLEDEKKVTDLFCNIDEAFVVAQNLIDAKGGRERKEEESTIQKGDAQHWSWGCADANMVNPQSAYELKVVEERGISIGLLHIQGTPNMYYESVHYHVLCTLLNLDALSTNGKLVKNALNDYADTEVGQCSVLFDGAGRMPLFNIIFQPMSQTRDGYNNIKKALSEILFMKNAKTVIRQANFNRAKAQLLGTWGKFQNGLRFDSEIQAIATTIRCGADAIQYATIRMKHLKELTWDKFSAFYDREIALRLGSPLEVQMISIEYLQEYEARKLTSTTFATCGTLGASEDPPECAVNTGVGELKWSVVDDNRRVRLIPEYTICIVLDIVCPDVTMAQVIMQLTTVSLTDPANVECEGTDNGHNVRILFKGKVEKWESIWGEMNRIKDKLGGKLGGTSDTAEKVFQGCLRRGKEKVRSDGDEGAIQHLFDQKTGVDTGTFVNKSMQKQREMIARCPIETWVFLPKYVHADERPNVETSKVEFEGKLKKTDLKMKGGYLKVHFDRVKADRNHTKQKTTKMDEGRDVSDVWIYGTEKQVDGAGKTVAVYIPIFPESPEEYLWYVVICRMLGGTWHSFGLEKLRKENGEVYGVGCQIVSSRNVGLAEAEAATDGATEAATEAANAAANGLYIKINITIDAKSETKAHLLDMIGQFKSVFCAKTDDGRKAALAAVFPNRKKKEWGRPKEDEIFKRKYWTSRALDILSLGRSDSAMSTMLSALRLGAMGFNEDEEAEALSGDGSDETLVRLISKLNLSAMLCFDPKEDGRGCHQVIIES